MDLDTLKEDWMANKRIGLFCGSFDPFHLNHLNIIHEVLNKKICDYVMVYAMFKNPHKPHMTPISIRQFMLQNIFKNDAMVVTTSKRPVDLLCYMKNHFATSKIIGIGGLDSFEKYVLSSQRFSLQDIQGVQGLNEKTIVSLASGGDEFILNMGKKDTLPIFFIPRELKIHLIRPNPWHISSTQIRQYIREGTPEELLKKYLNPETLKDIKHYGLYVSLPPAHL